MKQISLCFVSRATHAYYTDPVLSYPLFCAGYEHSYIL